MLRIKAGFVFMNFCATVVMYIFVFFGVLLLIFFWTFVLLSRAWLIVMLARLV